MTILPAIALTSFALLDFGYALGNGVRWTTAAAPLWWLAGMVTLHYGGAFTW